MMKLLKSTKKLIPFAIFVAALATLTGCNRGMGCPTWSIGDVIETPANDDILE